MGPEHETRDPSGGGWPCGLRREGPAWLASFPRVVLKDSSCSAPEHGT